MANNRQSLAGLMQLLNTLQGQNQNGFIPVGPTRGDAAIPGSTAAPSGYWLPPDMQTQPTNPLTDGSIGSGFDPNGSDASGGAVAPQVGGGLPDMTNVELQRQKLLDLLGQHQQFNEPTAPVNPAYRGEDAKKLGIGGVISLLTGGEEGLKNFLTSYHGTKQQEADSKTQMAEQQRQMQNQEMQRTIQAEIEKAKLGLDFAEQDWKRQADEVLRQRQIEADAAKQTEITKRAKMRTDSSAFNAMMSNYMKNNGVGRVGALGMMLTEGRIDMDTYEAGLPNAQLMDTAANEKQRGEVAKTAAQTNELTQKAETEAKLRQSRYDKLIQGIEESKQKVLKMKSDMDLRGKELNVKQQNANTSRMRALTKPGGDGDKEIKKLQLTKTRLMAEADATKKQYDPVTQAYDWEKYGVPHIRKIQADIAGIDAVINEYRKMGVQESKPSASKTPTTSTTLSDGTGIRW